MSVLNWRSAKQEGGRILLALGLALLVAFALIAAISIEPATASGRC